MEGVSQKDQEAQERRHLLVAELRTDIADAQRMANLSTYATNLLIVVGILGGAASASILAFAPEWPRGIPGVLAVVPGIAMALQGKLFERRIHHHRMKEVAYRGLLDQLLYEDVKVQSVSVRRRTFRDRSEREWREVSDRGPLEVARGDGTGDPLK